MKLKGKVALVTGGVKRVGKAISLALAKEGVPLAIHYNESTSEAKQTQAELHLLTDEVILIKGNFAHVNQIEKVVQKCVSHYGKIDILINNAAIYYRTPLAETTEKEWDGLFTVNLKAPFFCAKFASAYMKKSKEGKIINIADVAGISPWPGYIPYSASKAGLISITKGLAKALAPHIQVNAIASGTVLMRKDASKKYVEEIKGLNLLKRIGSPQDVVNAVLFLLKTDFVTGEVIAVDGGRLLA